MGPDIDCHTQIARRAAIEAGVALAADIDDLPVVDARRDAYFHFMRLPNMAAAAAFGARLLNDGSFAIAARANLGGGDHAERRALLGADLAAAITFRAGLGGGAFRGAGA